MDNSPQVPGGSRPAVDNSSDDWRDLPKRKRRNWSQLAHCKDDAARRLLLGTSLKRSAADKESETIPMATLNADPRLRAFLDLIAHSEGTATHPLTKCQGYDVIVTGVDGQHVFSDFSIHPFALGRQPITVRRTSYVGPDGPTFDPTHAHKPLTVIDPEIISTASGRYQIIWPTWKEISAQIRAGTFSPANQDLAALKLLELCNATNPILENAPALAIRMASNKWASFPGNLYNQSPHPLSQLLELYADLLQVEEPQ
jgi:muramidase (phage lysozyme)